MDATDCHICLEPLEPEQKDQYIHSTCCKPFHRKCMMKWLDQPNSEKKCAYCRSIVDPSSVVEFDMDILRDHFNLIDDFFLEKYKKNEDFIKLYREITGTAAGTSIVSPKIIPILERLQLVKDQLLHFLVINWMMVYKDDDKMLAYHLLQRCPHLSKRIEKLYFSNKMELINLITYLNKDFSITAQFEICMTIIYQYENASGGESNKYDFHQKFTGTNIQIIRELVNKYRLFSVCVIDSLKVDGEEVCKKKIPFCYLISDIPWYENYYLESHSI